MSTTAPWLLFLRHHRAAVLLGCAAGLAVVSAAAQHSEYGFVGRGEATTPLVRVITLTIGALAGVATGGNPPEVESLAGRRRMLAVNALVGAMLVASAALLAFAMTTGALLAGADAPWSLIAALTRSTIASAGLALLAATLLGHRYAWVLPIASMPLLTLVGSGADGEPLWWNTMNAAVTEPPSWAVALLLLATGSLAWNTHGWYWIAPWRQGR